MLVIIPFFRGDKPQAVRLAEWIAELGGVGKHDCLLAVHKDTDSAGVIEPLQKAFRRVAEFAITDEMIVEREQHAYAANVMWKRVANHVADMNEPADWFWLEPDAVPLLPGWLDAIASEHTKSGKPFLHCLVETPRGKSNSGCGVYPAKVRNYTDRLWELSDTSWDVLLYPDFAPHTAYTNLIQDIGFIPGTQTLPTFPDAASLSVVGPNAVLFHRVKDSSLVDRLREKYGSGEPVQVTQEAPASRGENGCNSGRCEIDGCENQAFAKRICRMHYARMWTRGTFDLPKKHTAKEKLILKRQIAETGCWLWTGYTHENGYGMMYADSRTPQLVHRVAYELFNGPIEDDLFVCHKCDVRNCFNPSHLFLGTADDNMKDAARKGRVSHGEKHMFSKLKDRDVTEIVRNYRDGVSQPEIAKKFGCCQANISMIVTGATWGTVTGLKKPAKTERKQKRKITPEHKAKLQAALAKAREAKARKAA